MWFTCEGQSCATTDAGAAAEEGVRSQPAVLSVWGAWPFLSGLRPSLEGSQTGAPRLKVRTRTITQINKTKSDQTNKKNPKISLMKE